MKLTRTGDTLPPAIASLHEVATQGDAKAQFKLARFYALGEAGVNKDPQRAVVWLQKSADQGHHSAQFSLGRCYELGSFLVGFLLLLPHSCLLFVF